MVSPVGKSQPSEQKVPEKKASSNYVLTKNGEFEIPFHKMSTEQKPKAKATPTPWTNPDKEFVEVYGLKVERALVNTVQRNHDNVPIITLNDGGNVSSPFSKTFSGEHPTIYIDKDGYTTFENMNDADITNFGDSNDKYKLKNTKNTCLFTGGGQDTVKVDNVSSGGIYHYNHDACLTLIDGAADPTKRPSMRDVKIDRDINNRLFWTEGTRFAD